MPIPDHVVGDEILTVDELAIRLRVKASWVYRYADQLGAYRLGKYLRFSWTRVLDQLARNTRIGVAAQQPSAERVNSRT